MCGTLFLVIPYFCMSLKLDRCRLREGFTDYDCCALSFQVACGKANGHLRKL